MFALLTSTFNHAEINLVDQPYLQPEVDVENETFEKNAENSIYFAKEKEKNSNSNQKKLTKNHKCEDKKCIKTYGIDNSELWCIECFSQKELLHKGKVDNEIVVNKDYNITSFQYLRYDVELNYFYCSLCNQYSNSNPQKRRNVLRQGHLEYVGLSNQSRWLSISAEYHFASNVYNFSLPFINP